jgi:hypothetical protein
MPGFALVLFLAAIVSPVAAAQREAVSIELEVLPAAKRYVDLAAYPSYLAVALKNNGFSPSDSGLLILKDGHSLRFKNAELTFIKQDKGVFHYSAAVEWSFGIGQSKFEIPAQADLSKVGDGKVVVRFFPPLAQFFPEKVTDGLRLKIQSLAAPAAQKRMLQYFDGLPGSKDGRLDTARMFERIMLDAYNLAAVAPALLGAREPGDAEPLADQWMLLATLAFWLVIVPGFFVARAAWRMRKARKGMSK